MKRFLTAASALLSVQLMFAQQPVVITGGLVKKTKLLTTIYTDTAYEKVITRDENGLVGVPKKTAVIHPYREERPPVPDPVAQNGNAPFTEAASATIGANFNGMGYTSVNPSDPVIVTGPNHVIQMINSSSGSLVKIFNKDGTQALAQFNFKTITGVTGAGDPILLYDKLANRWLLTEFGYSNGVTTYVNTLILAVSANENPLGSWYVYKYADNSFFVDFPKFSVWTDAYYATSNDFNTGGTTYLGSSVYAFNRTAMLSGAPAATAIRVRMTSPDDRYFSLAPVTYEGVNAPPAGTKGMFLYYTNDAFTSDPADVDSIYLITMTPDFITPANTVISTPVRFVPAAFDDELCTATRGRCIDQQTATGTDLEDLAGRFSNRIVYRNFGTHEGILGNFTVDADGAGKGGIRWMELQNTGGGWGIFQQGTYAPDGNERWLGSLTYDGAGNIGLVYNVSGTTANPSIRFTGRNACDPLGSMTLPETVIINGTSSNGSNRYGDYNMLAIDPATDRDFWLTAQYNGASSWSTRIASFVLNDCSPTPKVRFYTNEILAYEDSLTTSGTGCEKYRDYVVNMVISNAPSQPAVITFQTTGSTATAGSDFTITPASVTLNAGNLSQPVTIRVYADANVEPAETISLSYSLNASGGDAVSDNYNQACLIRLYDNDRTFSPNQNSIVLLSEGFGTDASPGPAGAWTITNTGTNNSWTYSGNLDATNNGTAHVTNNTISRPVTYTKTATATSLLKTPLINASAFSDPSDSLKLFVRYQCNGELFSGTYYDYGYLMYSTDGTNFSVIPGTSYLQGVTTMTDLNVNLPPTLNGTSFYLGFYWVNDNSAGTDPPFVLDSMAVIASGLKIKTTVGAASSLYVTSSQPVYFKSTDGELIASMSNTGSIGCLTASVASAGVGRTAATINGNAAFRSDKVIQFTPASTYNGNHRMTLYFTTAELAAWGVSASGLNILQVPDSDPLAAVITGTVVNAIVQDLRATRGYVAYTGVFNGFSKFLLTDAPTNSTLPVNGLVFNATPLSREIGLTWSTETETDNRGFYIERSTEGTTFKTIGFLEGKGTTSDKSYYNYYDRQVQRGTWYFYRLRQVDFNDRVALSAVRKAQLRNGTQDLLIIPNPVAGNCRLKLGMGNGSISVTITDISGKVIRQDHNLAMANGYAEFSVSAVPQGVYVVKAVSAGITYTGILVKQ